ncbi:MAG TPA: GAF domain-containing protein [Acidimicrobiales bacterium]|nr:GAF domain-containing protein [Acidimicrobiales bacterium]
MSSETKASRQRPVWMQPWAIVAAIVLVAIPSLFGFFPEMGTWSLEVRSLIAASWIGTVVASVIIGAKRDVRLAQVVETVARQRDQLRLRATEDILSALLRPGTKDIPANYGFTVYLLDPERDELRAAFPSPGPDSVDLLTFRPGAGATGLAFQKRQLILVTGDAVSDATHGLTPGQREHFASYRVVVATPIWREGLRPIGVLTAISEENDGHFDKDSSVAALRELADVIGVVLTSVYGAEVG